MKIIPNNPPRMFKPSPSSGTTISDCGTIMLTEDEMVTFGHGLGMEYDVTHKDWGFYATPSINGRLASFGWKTALVKGHDDKLYVFVVDPNKSVEFNEYLDREGHSVVEWLDER